jgi:hypothetical protein
MPLLLLSAGTLAVATKRATLCTNFRSAVEMLAGAKLQIVRTRLPFFIVRLFPNSLNEIGRESGNVACSRRGAYATSLCDAQNLYDRKRLVLIAHLVRCVDFEAAMHNRSSEIE